jgi:hypothetical protein
VGKWRGGLDRVKITGSGEGKERMQRADRKRKIERDRPKNKRIHV